MSAFVELKRYKDNTVFYLFSGNIELIEDKGGSTTVRTRSGKEYYVKNKAHDIMISAGFSPENK